MLARHGGHPWPPDSRELVLLLPRAFTHLSSSAGAPATGGRAATAATDERHPSGSLAPAPALTGRPFGALRES